MNKNSSIPIFQQNISFKEKMKAFVAAIGKYLDQGNILNNSKVVIYYILLSLFPIVIIIGNLLPFLNLNVTEVIEYSRIIFPSQVSNLLEPTIRQILSQQSGGLISFGIIVALWSSSKAINSIRQGINEIYGVKKISQYTKKPLLDIVLKRGMSFVITILSVLAFFVVTVVLIFGQIFLEWVIKTFQIEQEFLKDFLTWKWPIALTVVFLALFFLYYFLPSVKIKFKSVVMGTILTTTGFSLLTQFFSLYMRYFGTAWNSYGTIGAFIVFLLWMNASSTVFMFGGVVNAAFAECLDGDFKVLTRKK
ncbi:YihY/virulence factor BrkB family protein [Lactobacillus sp. YT155]|uniref:YihY/virulence factor BrkB family protein n=1 Tax=Lactobacillus sp. YT155 TaxID=3060955 RepID=UPI00265EDCFD|nr:YihY/virulence factor BrkB family protein [Lactobacillus sp. YT155]MDO1605198.1 YihY/virulence factor BrkB family protein [Lactobacillus sp. YT155]